MVDEINSFTSKTTMTSRNQFILLDKLCLLGNGTVKYFEWLFLLLTVDIPKHDMIILPQKESRTYLSNLI